MFRLHVVPLALILAAGCQCDGTSTDSADARLELSGAPVRFGGVLVGTTRERVLVLQNPARGPLEIRSIALASESPELQVIAGGLLIEGGREERVTLRFTPASEGARTFELVIAHDAAEAPVRVPVTGAGFLKALAIEPSTLDFGPAPVGETVEREVAITNALGDPLDLTAPVPTGDGAGAFAIVGQGSGLQPIRLEGGATAALRIAFTPELLGVRAAAIALVPCGGCPAESLGLIGLGVESWVVPDPLSVDFGAIVPGKRARRQVTLKNHGNVELAFAGASIADANRDVALVTAAPFAPLAPGASFVVELEYKPTGLGPDQTRLLVDLATEPAQRLVVPVRGYGGGPVVQVRPETLDLGHVAVGSPVTRRLTIANVGLNDPSSTVDDLVVRSATLSREGEFTIALPAGGSWPLTISPGPRVGVDVTYIPAASGAANETLVLATNDAAAAEVRVPLVATAIAPTPCDWELQPGGSELPFGLVPRGRVTRRSVLVRNRGATDCLLQRLELVERTPQVFALPAGAVFGRVLAPGEHLLVEVEFAPPATAAAGARFEAELDVAFVSATAPRRLTLSGRAVESCIVISPPGLAFGVVAPACETDARRLTIHNACTSPVSVTSIALGTANGAFRVGTVTTPFTIAAGGARALEVRFRPPVAGMHVDAIAITTNQAANGGTPYVVPLSGRGEVDARAEESFPQAGRPRSDILFVVDNSGSMGEEQGSLAANFRDFMQFAVGQQSDYQLGVTTTAACGGSSENGRLVPLAGGTRIVTPYLPEPEATFRANVRVGTGGCGNETGLETAFLALSEPLVNAHNAGFLRADANLSVILVSDEPDQSSRSLEFYASFFQGLKGPGREQLVSVSSIVGFRRDALGNIVAQGCSGPGGSAGYGGKYLEIADRTGGIVESICTNDWAQALRRLGETSFGWRSRFVLSGAPDPATLRVFIDADEVPAGPLWSFSAPANSVDFLPTAIPPAGSTVRITYSVACR